MKSVALLAPLALAVACSKAPAEPDAPARSTSEVATVAPLLFDAPGTWTSKDVPRSGAKRALFDTPLAGDAKVGAEVEVDFWGTGALGDPDKRKKEWFDAFDGDVGKTAERASFVAKSGLEIELVEVKGTYKVNLTPPAGPKQKVGMQMVKQDYRLVGAIVKAKERGNWFFRMVGPDAAVLAAKDAFRAMLESAR